ncbi:MAG: lysozyme inhibitor LprI family protein [Sarcina sp.]
MKFSKLQIICGAILTVTLLSGAALASVTDKKTEKKILTEEKDISEDTKKKEVTDLSEFSKKYTEKLALCEAKLDELYLEFCKKKNPMTEEKTMFAVNTATLWDDELQLIYNELKEILTAEEFKKLEKEQVEWKKKRDENARVGKSLEMEIAYKVGIDTRNRCYQLIDIEAPKITRECKSISLDESTSEEKKPIIPEVATPKPVPPPVKPKPEIDVVDQTERFKALIELPCHCVIDNERYKDLPDYHDCSCRNATAESKNCGMVTCYLPLGCEAGCSNHHEKVPFCPEHDPLGFEAHIGHVNDNQSTGYCEYGVSWEK